MTEPPGESDSFYTKLNKRKRTPMKDAAAKVKAAAKDSSQFQARSPCDLYRISQILCPSAL